MSNPYRRLVDGLTDMMRAGRLREEDIPDDYEWLADALSDAVYVNPAEGSWVPPPVVAFTNEELSAIYYVSHHVGSANGDVWDSIIDKLKDEGGFA